MGHPVEAAGRWSRRARAALATGAWLVAIAASVPVQANCGNARLITMAKSAADRTYVNTPGVCPSGFGSCGYPYYSSVTGYAQGNFWLIGYGDPTVTAGVDNGAYVANLGNTYFIYTSGNPYAGWLSPNGYYYPAWVRTSWAADNGIDGCPDNTIASPNCTAILLGDHLNDEGYFAYLTSEANQNLDYRFDQPGNVITLAQIPSVTIASTTTTSSTSVDITVGPPFGPSPGPAEGFYLDPGCASLPGSPTWGVRARNVGLGSPPPSGRDLASWPTVLGSALPFDGNNKIVTASCTEEEVVYLAYTIEFDSGNRSFFVGCNSVGIECGGECVDDDFDGACAGNDCDDSPATGASCNTGCGTFYRDLDGDGSGDAGVSVSTCVAPAGYVANGSDCDDSTETGATCSTTCSPFYRDMDGDGFGDAGDSVSTCVAPAGYIADNQDCDDGNADCDTDCTDGDGDNICDNNDNCPADFNPGQENADGDSEGDVCDPDDDNDGILDDGDNSGTDGDNPCTGGETTNCDDNCPFTMNADQRDGNGNLIGTACEPTCELVIGPQVGTDFPTIAAALPPPTVDGCVLRVKAGTYTDALVIDKFLTIIGEDGAAATLISGAGSGTALTLSSRVVPGTTRIRGVTIEDFATGIDTEVSLELRDSVVESFSTAGVRLGPESHLIRGVRVESATGALGVELESSGTALLDRVRIEGITGTALSVLGDLDLTTSLIVKNPGTGVLLGSSGSLDVQFTTIGDNGTGLDAAFPALSVSQSIIYGNTTDVVGAACTAFTFSDLGIDCTSMGDNISADPLYVSTAAGDFHLTFGSPAIESGFAPETFTGAPCKDYDGNPRLLDVEGDGLAIPDMGAYEFDNASSLSPGDPQNLVMPDRVSLAWDAEPSSVLYKVNRGTLATLGYDFVVVCHGTSATPSFTLPADLPAPGDGFWYTVSGEDSGSEEGTLGLGTCAERSKLLTPCP